MLRIEDEADFQAFIKSKAESFGYIYYHTWRSYHSPAGFPDTTMARLEPVPRLIYAELKFGNNQPTEDQWVWLYILQHIGSPVEAYLWYPDDIQEMLEILR